MPWFKTKPYPHQLAALEKGKDKKFFAYFMQYGSGKSKVLLDNAAYLYDSNKISGILVVAPKGVLRNWIGETDTHLSDHVERMIGWYDAEGGKEMRDSIKNICASAYAGLRILLVNVESLISPKALELCEQFLKSGHVMIVADESTTLKNPRAKRTKAAIYLGRKAAYTRILTGDPYANSPLNVFAQFQFLKEGSLGFTSEIAFRNRFARVAPVPGAPRWVRRVVGFKDLEALKVLVGPHAFFAEKPTLPPKVYMPHRECLMLPSQKQAYEDMRRYSLIEIGRQLELDFMPKAPEATLADLMAVGNNMAVVSPVTNKVKTASAEIVLTQLMRLQQISAGFVKTETGEEVDLCEGQNPRIAEVLAIIEEMGPGTKVIVWAVFKHSIRDISEVLRSEYGSDSVVVYDGSTSSDDREAAKIAFQKLDGPVRFFVGNQATAGRGITLTAATAVIYYNNNFDAEQRANSEDRCHRIGLDHSVVYVDLVSAPIDLKVIDALKAKKTISEMLQDGSWKELFK